MKKDKVVIPVKNYIIVSLVGALTVLVVIYFMYWYKVVDSQKENNDVMSDFLSEFGEEEIINNVENYVLDNPDTIIYMSSSDDSSLKKFEDEFKDFLDKNNLKSLTVYMDLSKIKSGKVISDFSERFFSSELKEKNVELIRQPNLLIFSNGEVTSMLYYSKQNISMSDVKSFLIENEVIVND